MTALLRGETELPPLAYGAFQEQDVRNVPQYAGHHLQNIAHLQQHFDDQMSYGKPPPHMTMNHVGHRGMAPQYQEDDDDGSAETENSPPAKLSRGHGGHRYDSHPHHFQTQHFQQVKG